jgi:hypothetical protein
MRRLTAASTLLAALLSVNASSSAHARQSPPSSWIELGGSATDGGISNYPGYSTLSSMAVDPSGYPVVAWRQTTPGASSVYLRRWNGTAWVELDGSASGGGVSGSIFSDEADVAVDAGGNPAVAWAGNGDIYFRRWNGSAWEELAGSGSPGGISNLPDMGSDPSLALDANGYPCIAWASGDDIYLKRWNGSSWEQVGFSASPGVINPGGGGSQPHLALDPLGAPILVWKQFVGLVGGTSVYDIYLRRWSGSAWVEQETRRSPG